MDGSIKEIIIQVTWSIILLKDSHLFKIVELKKNFKQKLITDSTILNKWEFFSRIVDKWHGLSENCIISRSIGLLEPNSFEIRLFYWNWKLFVKNTVNKNKNELK